MPRIVKLLLCSINPESYSDAEKVNHDNLRDDRHPMDGMFEHPRTDLLRVGERMSWQACMAEFQ
jgi:hypothetical protein